MQPSGCSATPPVPVLAPGTGRTKTGQLWLYVRDDRSHAGKQRVRYSYTPDRKGERPGEHLKALSGLLQADGYAGFEGLYGTGHIDEVACWAHVRRKFFDVHQANGSTVARQALDWIGALYAIEQYIPRSTTRRAPTGAAGAPGCCWPR